MGKAFKCDRCGDLAEGKSVGDIDARGDAGDAYGRRGLTDNPRDLCGECSDSFIEWWQTGDADG